MTENPLAIANSKVKFKSKFTMSNENSTTNKVLRDFIYVNLERLYSVYSQVFEGVVDTIVRSVTGKEKRKPEKRGIRK